MASVAIARKVAKQNDDSPAVYEVDRAARRQAASVWATMNKVAGDLLKTGRDDLIDGSSAVVNLKISGTVDGFEVAPIDVQSIVAVGHEITKASSSLPQPSQLLAIAFAKLNAKTRASIIAEVTAEFAASGEYPEVDDAVSVEVEEFLSAMRKSQPVVSRGPVKVQYVLQSNGAQPQPAAVPGKSA